MKIELDIDSKRALKMLTVAVNDLIAAIVSLHGELAKNTAALEGE